MQIWFYKRECQLGDYVYADGSFSDKLNKKKTVVGVCFYINPNDASQRLCVATRDLDPWQWGLFPDDWQDGITLADAPNYNVFDISTLANKDTRINADTITEGVYRDESTGQSPDGFKTQPDGTPLAELGWTSISTKMGAYEEGAHLPWGLINTLKIIAHRDIILSDSNVDLPIPQKNGGQSQLANLTQLMQQVVSDNSGDVRYRELYYPAASLCNSFEPETMTGEILSERFKTGRWFLPSCGELARLYWWHSHNELQERKENGIFARPVMDGKFAPFGSQYYWTSTEFSSLFAWAIGFFNANLYYYYKKNAWYVRPIAAF